MMSPCSRDFLMTSLYIYNDGSLHHVVYSVNGKYIL